MLIEQDPTYVTEELLHEVGQVVNRDCSSDLKRIDDAKF